MLSQGQVGQTQNADGIQVPLRAGRQGDQIVSELHGRFYEQAYRGNLFSYGNGAGTATITNTTMPLSANTITFSATTTPIVGVWNPLSSQVNLVILQATLNVFANNLTSGAGPGAFVWAVSTGNSAISTGGTPFNRKTLTTAGSSAKGFGYGSAAAIALTGLTNALSIFDIAQFSNPTSLTYTTLASTSLLTSYGGVQNFDGSVIVPPGGVLALLNTVSSTTFSAAAQILWEEVPL